MTEPIACTLSPAGLRDRRADWQALADRALIAAERSGPALVRQRYRDDPGVAEELERLATLERECCAFLAMTVRRAAGEVVLEVAGPAEAEPVLEQFLVAGK